MLDRRGFLMLGAGATAGLVASPIIWNTLYDAAYWTQNWSWIPRLQYGENQYVSTVSKLCPSGTGLRIRLVDGRPVRALGNPDNPMSQGALTALAAAETQLLVSPARLKRPLKRSSDGAYVAISWDEAKALLLAKMQDAGSSVACVSGDPNGIINELFSAVLKLSGSRDFYLMPSEEQGADIAAEAMGFNGRIGYDIENSDYVLALGANILESWGTVARNRKAYGATHPAGEEPSMRLVYSGPMQNNTAAGADMWMPAKSGTEGQLAMGIAHLLLKSGANAKALGLGDFAALASRFTPEKVSQICGVSQAQLEQVAKELQAAEKPLVIVGSSLGYGCGSAPIMAGIAVNMLLGRVGEEGNLTHLPYPPKVLSSAMNYKEMQRQDFVRYSLSVAGGSEAPKVLIFHEANALYAMPPAAKVGDLLKSAGFTVSMSCFMDETTAQSDLVLPLAFGIERYDDVYTPYGSGVVNYAVGVPALEPKYEAMPASTVLLELAAELGFSDMLAEDMPTLIASRAELIGADFDSMTESGAVYMGENEPVFFIPYLNAEAIGKGLMVPAEGTVMLAAQTLLGFGTAQTGIPPFATRIITDAQLEGKLLVGQMNSATASALGLKQGDRVRLSNAAGSINAKVAVFEGLMPNTVSVPAGLGHTAFDEFSQNKGDNIMNVCSVTQEADSGLYVPVLAGVSIAKV